jgi:hypothetical protein
MSCVLTYIHIVHALSMCACAVFVCVCACVRVVSCVLCRKTDSHSACMLVCVRACMRVCVQVHGKEGFRLV